MAAYMIKTTAGAQCFMRIDNMSADDPKLVEVIQYAIDTARRACGPCDDQMLEFVEAMEASGIEATFSNHEPDTGINDIIDIPVL